MDTPLVTGNTEPRMPMHATDVAVVQLVVLQSASAITIVTVTSVRAKLAPVSVTLATTYPTLYGNAAVIAGPVGCSVLPVLSAVTIQLITCASSALPASAQKARPSKLNTALDVPTTPDDVRPAMLLR